MVKIYTKKGDNGTTSLVAGTRVSKADPRVCLYGSLDELNSLVGLVSAQLCTEVEYFREELKEIQRDLFTVQTLVACEVEKRAGYKICSIEEQRTQFLEKQIDKMTAEIKPLKNFILPGGSVVSSTFHLCRTRCRAIERAMIEYRSDDDRLESEISFLNRLSDYFFVAARYSNKLLGVEDVLYD